MTNHMLEEDVQQNFLGFFFFHNQWFGDQSTNENHRSNIDKLFVEHGTLIYLSHPSRIVGIHFCDSYNGVSSLLFQSIIGEL